MGHRSKTTRQRSHHRTAIGATSATVFAAAQTAAAADDAATQPYHDALTNHVPGFITAPGQTDYLFIAVIILILVIILAIGNFYFQLHAVPERIAHRANKAQLEIVAVLALISLFTHNHLYWIVGLLLAMVRIPDFSTPLYSIARSIARIASRGPEVANADDAPPAPAPAAAPVHAPAPGAQAASTQTPQAATAASAPAHPAAAAPMPAASAPAARFQSTGTPATATRIAEPPAVIPPVAADPATASPTAEPVAGAPIAPLPAAATHPQPAGHANALPGQQPNDPTVKPGAKAEGI